MKKKELRKRIDEEEDFIHHPRLSNSLKKFVEKNPEGIDEDKIAKVLLLSEEELTHIFNGAIEKIRKSLKIK